MKFLSLRSFSIAFITLLGLWIFFILGAEWELQWSMDTGKQRTISRLYGHQTSISEPKETIISNWLQAQGPDESWQTVAKGEAKETALITYSYSRIYGHLRELEKAVRIPDDRKKFAQFFLDEIGKGDSVNLVASKLYNLRERVQNLRSERFFPDEPVTFEELKTFWDQEQREN